MVHGQHVRYCRRAEGRDQVERLPDAGIAESQHIGLAVSVQVGDEPGGAAAAAPKPSMIRFGVWKVPSPLLIATHTPSSAKPTMSPVPSPARGSRCGRCGRVSTRVHSRYRRHMADLPGRGVRWWCG